MTLFFIGLITGMLISLVCYFTAYIILKSCEDIKECEHINENKQGVLNQIAEEQKTLLDTTKAWSDYIDKHGDIY